MSLAINSTVFDGKYTILKKLDEGRYGQIFKIQQTNDPTKYYALKAIAKEDMRINASLKENISREIRIHQSLDHPNIVKLIETGYTAPLDDYRLIVLEYVDFGDTWDLLYKSDNHYLTESEACDYFYQLIQALIYLRDLGIIHRDLKPENILITKSGIIKLADFGWAIDRPSAHYVGTTKYCSPEMIASHSKYNYKTDVWSAGIILYEFLYGQVPFDSNKEHKIEYKIQHKTLTFPEFPPVSDSAKNLIRNILNRNPDKRPDYDKILSHKWMENATDDNTGIEDFSDIEFDEELNKEIEDELELLRNSLTAPAPAPTAAPTAATPPAAHTTSPIAPITAKFAATILNVIESETDWSDE